MKNIIFICCLIAFSFLAEKISAQAPPQKMTYQFVARNSQNQLIQNNAVGLRISILQGAPNGNAVYVETHTPQTNGNGTATIEVGGGAPVSGVFANIDWSTGVYFIQTEMDPQGAQGYSVTAVSQLLSVPYAFYAGRATVADSVAGGMNETDPNFTASVAAGITPADTARWNQDLVDDADNNPTNELQTLTAAGNTISLSNGGGSVTLTERDSIFAASVAAGITAADTTRWNNGGNDWKLSGNAGTDPNSNFIGTTDSTDFVVRTNNVERMRVSRNGNVGVGTNNPAWPFQVGNAANNGFIAFKGDNNNGNIFRYGGTGTNAGLLRFVGQADIESMRIADNGNIGIGTTNPIGKLHVNNDIIGSDSSFVVTEGGKVGIGTNNPSANFEIINSNGIFQYTPIGAAFINRNAGTPLILRNSDVNSSNNIGHIEFRRGAGNGTSAFITSTCDGIGSVSALGINFGGNNFFRVLSNGNIGIGTTAPATKLQVSAGDVYIDNIGSGVIMKSPNGSCWRVTVDNTGNLIRTAITCP